ncbi:anaphase-promoting complex, cyclosome, subunit 4-domain-containing protein [Chytriomyces cf. hyalinus JEL632]|nr:anaphase-promoting complex, cyclosome, subunit 4-domain-containing protein [Chytriomyces cf. hyalinus JEL632]
MELVSSSRQHAQNVTWCPGRDLVGLVLGDSDVAAARLNAATVWRSTHASVVAAVCWKGRDGRLLACARSLSRTAPVAVVSILDAETGVRVAGAHLQPPAMSRHPLIHLFWPAASIPRNTIPARIRALRDSAIISSLPPAVIPAEPGSSPASPLDLFDRIVGSTSSQDVLIAVRRDGTVEFSLWGLFYIGSFRLTLKDNDFKEVSVLQSINTDSLDSIIFLLEVATSKEISPKRKECFVATIDTGRVFIAHGSQLCSIAYHALKLNHLVSDLEILMGFVEREYDGFNDVSRKQVQNLKEAFMRQDEMKTPLESLRFLLATGNASPALESYLCGHSLGERGLRKWKTSFTNGFTHIESCVYSGVIPLIERIIAHLTELLGYCRIGGKYTKLGLSESPVTVCIEWVLKFAKEIQAVCQSLNRDLEAHAEFFVWLTFGKAVYQQFFIFERKKGQQQATNN